MNEEMTLYLPLKSQWFNMIESSEKKEEYREIKPFWCQRLQLKQCFEKKTECCDRCSVKFGKEPRKYRNVVFSFGYTKKKMEFEIEDIEISRGNPDWGAPEDKDVFIIKLGQRLK